MSNRTDEVWKSAPVVSAFLSGVRGAIPLAAEQLDVMLRLVAGAGIEVRRILDLGCGDGVLAAALLERYPAAEAVLADFSPAMLEAARARLGGRGTYALADYGAPNWGDAIGGPFDVIVSGLSIHHQPDSRKREVYAEILRLLAPGGVFVHIEHVKSATKWVGSVNDELFIDSLHAHRAHMTREQVAEQLYYRPDKASNILAPVETQCEWLRELGYTDVDCYFKIFELAVFGGRRPSK
jgi:ubiquinone/menaquinone biosynthesis C-methylase UbiE